LFRNSFGDGKRVRFEADVGAPMSRDELDAMLFPWSMLGNCGVGLCERCTLLANSFVGTVVIESIVWSLPLCETNEADANELAMSGGIDRSSVIFAVRDADVFVKVVDGVVFAPVMRNVSRVELLLGVAGEFFKSMAGVSCVKATKQVHTL